MLLLRVTIDFLRAQRAAFLALERRAAAGIDAMTWEQYSEGLEEKLKRPPPKTPRGSVAGVASGESDENGGTEQPSLDKREARVSGRSLRRGRSARVLERWEERMKGALSTLAAIALVAMPLANVRADTKEQDRLKNCGVVLNDIVNIPDGIPQELVDKAECAIVVPSVLKVAFVIGGAYGRGAMTCRSGVNWSGPWGAPVMMALEGGNVGFQLGGQATDFIILVMNPRGATAILKNKVKLGADASVAAGPKGRTASADTDVTLRAEMLTYSRSRGLFAGVSLEGSTLRPDNGANEKTYGKKIEPSELVRSTDGIPAAAQQMIAVLTKLSPRNLSDPASLR